MTRDIERRLEQLEDDSDPDPALDRETSITRALVVRRERAERESREILGPADVTADGDFVKVNPES